MRLKSCLNKEKFPFINCGMTSELSDNKKQDYKEMIPLNRFGETSEISKVVKFLVLEDSSYLKN